MVKKKPFFFFFSFKVLWRRYIRIRNKNKKFRYQNLFVNEYCLNWEFLSVLFGKICVQIWNKKHRNNNNNQLNQNNNNNNEEDDDNDIDDDDNDDDNDDDDDDEDDDISNIVYTRKPANAQLYLQALMFVIDTYRNGKIPDYDFCYDCGSPTPAELIECGVTRFLNTAVDVPRAHNAPMSPNVFALSILPPSALELVCEPVRAVVQQSASLTRLHSSVNETREWIGALRTATMHLQTPFADTHLFKVSRNRSLVYKRTTPPPAGQKAWSGRNQIARIVVAEHVNVRPLAWPSTDFVGQTNKPQQKRQQQTQQQQQGRQQNRQQSKQQQQQSNQQQQSKQQRQQQQPQQQNLKRNNNRRRQPQPQLLPNQQTNTVANVLPSSSSSSSSLQPSVAQLFATFSAPPSQHQQPIAVPPPANALPMPSFMQPFINPYPLFIPPADDDQ